MEPFFASAVPKRRRPARSIFDGFRDFQTETSTSPRKSVLASFSTVTFLPFTFVNVLLVVRQEQELRNGTVDKKLSTLADLFRPPIELMHKGSFETVRSLSKGILHPLFWSCLCELSDDFSKHRWKVTFVKNSGSRFLMINFHFRNQLS